jgi:tetratricopeptide (TPR) repeat protein
MELVRGQPITAYCDEHQVGTAERLQLFMKVCQAVQHAHQKGIIHRDLKPTNILVTLIDGEPVPKVIDFGVAKALGQKLTEKTLFTSFHQMIGTPAYMSPEQAELSGVDVDSRSDIYSLGVLLYELLTGVTPFDAETLHKAALDEMRRIIRETEPPKPSTRLQSFLAADVRRLKSPDSQPSTLNSQPAGGASSRRLLQLRETIRSVRGDLDWIVMKAIEKDRARRYETASALVDDIQHHLDHQPVRACPPSAVYRARKFVRRHRFGVAMATTLVLALSIGLTVALIGFAEARQQRDRAERFARELAQQRQRDDVRKFCSLGLWQQCLEQCQAMSRFYTNDPSLDCIAAVTTLLAGQPETYRAECLRMLSRYGYTSDVDAAERTARTCTLAPDPALDGPLILRLAESSLARDPTNLWRQFAKGAAEYRLGHYQEAILYLQPLHMERDTQVSCAAGYLLALAHHRLDQPAEAQAALRRPNLRFKECLRQLACAEALSECFDSASAILFRAEAERTILGSEVSPKVDAPTLEGLRTSWATAVRFMERGLKAGRSNDWPEAAAAFEKSLQEPAFDFSAPLTTAWPELAIGVPFVRTGDLERHRELCRKLVTHVNGYQCPPRMAERAARACLLSPVLSPDLLELASNWVALAATGVATKEVTQVSESMVGLCEGMLAYRTGRYTEAIELVRKSGAVDYGEQLIKYPARLLQGMAAKRLGHDRVAEVLWHTAKIALPRIAEVMKGREAHLPRLQMFELLLDEAEPLFAKPSDQPQPERAAAGAQGLEELALPKQLLKDQDVDQWLIVVARDLEKQGKLAEAEAAWRELATEKRITVAEHSFVANSLLSLARVLRAQGKVAEAEAVQRDALAMLRKYQGSENSDRPWALASWATVLLDQKKFVEAEPLARECLAIRTKTIPDNWLTFNARSLLGGSLLGQKRYAEAELLLLSAYEGMKQREDKIPQTGKVRLKETLQRLVQLYEDTGGAAQAAEWKQKLAEFEHTQTQAPPAAPPATKAAAPVRALLEEGYSLAQQQRWPEARDAYVRAWAESAFEWRVAEAMSPFECLSLHMGIVFVQAEDGANYERLCRLLVSLDPKQVSPNQAERYAKTCSLNSQALPPDLRERALALARFAVANRHRSHDPSWTSLSGGMAEYRAGEWEQAVERCRKAEKSNAIGCQGGAMVYRAIALKQLGREEEARRVLTQAEALLAEPLQMRSDSNWWDLEICLLALEEARQLIGQSQNAAREKWAPVRRLLEEGLSLAQQKRWPEARDAYGRAWAESAFDWRVAEAISPIECLSLHMGIAFVQAEDRANYERLCRLLVSLDPEHVSPTLAERYAKTCSLTPWTLPPDLRQRALELARFAVANRHRSADPYWTSESGGMAEYRAGEWEQAVERCREAEKSNVIGCQGGAMVYRAMALRRLGRTEEARKVLAQAEELLAEPIWTRMNSEAQGWDWELDICQLALEEARELIGQPAKP